jgi:hypothetical protein
MDYILAEMGDTFETEAFILSPLPPFIPLSFIIFFGKYAIFIKLCYLRDIYTFVIAKVFVLPHTQKTMCKEQRNIPEERRSHLHRGGSPKSRSANSFMNSYTGCHCIYGTLSNSVGLKVSHAKYFILRSGRDISAPKAGIFEGYN